MKGNKMPENGDLQRLFTLLKKSVAWGSENGFPAFRKYPQYRDVRIVGEEIGRREGFAGLRAALSWLSSLPDSEIQEFHSGGMRPEGWATSFWNGINTRDGDWRS